MKNFYKVSNTIENGPRMDRVKSRISPMNHRLWTVIGPMLLVAFGLFGVNESAWATWPTYEGSCSTNGYVVYDASCDWSTISSREIKLAGPGATITFQAKRTKLGAGNVKVDQYVNGEWSFLYETSVGTSYGNYTVNKTLDPQATKIKFYTTTGATLHKYVQQIRVTRYSDNAYALYDNNLDCGSADYNLANSDANYTTGTAYVDWSHSTTLPTCTITGSNPEYFEIKSQSNKPAANKNGTMSIVINYKHTAPGDHSATLKVGGKTITIKGHTNKITPYIVTTPTVDTITYGQTISNSQLHGGLVKADLINNTGATVAGTWTIDENGQTVTASGGANTTVNLTFTPADQNTYNVIHTTQTMYVRSASTITWASAYSATKPTIPIGKTIENAATTNAAGATVTYSTSAPDVIVIENEGTTFRAIAEGEATITASHGVTPTHGAASEEKTFKTTFKDIQVIVWNDRFDRLTTEMTSKNLLAQVWIENPVSGERTYSAARTALLEYSVEDNTVVSIPNNSTTLTIHKKGNTTLTASVEGNEQYESASVTMVVKVREPSAGCDDPLLLDEKNNGTNDYLYRLFDNSTSKPELHTDEYAINVAQGQVPDKLSFAHKGEEYKVVGLSFWTYYSGTIKAQQKVNGDWIDVPNSSVTPEKSKWNTIEGLQLDEKATHIRFVRPQGGEGYHYVRNVEVTMKHFIRTATPTVDFGNTIKVNSSEYQDVVVKYSNVKDALQVVNPFTSGVTVSDEVIDVDSCGAFGSATLRISFSPTTATEIDDYIVVKDPIVGNSSALSIRVKADVQRADQTITWNPATSISTIDQILLNGTTNGQEYGQMNVIGYEVTNNDGVISVTNNVVTILKPGTVTITASQPGTTNYDVAEPVEKNFTISAEPLTLVAPTASDITYGQALPTLIGGSAKDSKGNDVDGTFAWQNPDAVLNAGNNQTPTVVFTPSENAAWYTGLTTTTTINVAKADPVATVENVSFAYGTKAEDISLVGTGAGTWNWTDSRKGETLTVGEYEMDVHFAPTDATNYNAIDTKITLTVAKADPEVTVSAVEINYGTLASNVTLSGTGLEGTWSWTDTRKDDVLAAGSYTMDVHFVPTDATNYNEKDVTVSLTVNKADPVVAANAVEINYGATASSVDLEGTGVAGTWSWTDTRKDQVLAAGSYTMNVHFIPNDATNYNEKDATVALTVKKADPVVAANAVEITYGATASNVTLSGTGVAGTWSWTDSRKDDILAAGSYTMNVHFIPNDATNYNEKDATVALTVKKATTTLSWTSNPTDLAYNATDAVYTATSASDGAITYSIISGGSYAHIDANTGALTIDLPGNTITIQAEQAEGTNYSAPTTITVEVAIAAAPVGPNSFTNNAGDNDWQNAENWTNGVPSGVNPDVIISGALIIDESVTVGGLTILPTGGVTIVDDGKLTVNGTTADQSGYGDLYVKNDGAVILGNSANLQVRDFKLDAKLGDGDTKAASGQVKGDDKLNVNGDAYFQLSFDPAGAISYGWYDFTVPFPVNISGGIERINSTSDKVMVCGQDFLLMEDDEVSFVNGGKGWRQISSGVLEPGKLYTITFDDEVNQNTFRFAWNGQGSITNGDTFAAQCLTGSDASRNGWNALGNAMLQHGYVDGSYKLQAYDHTYNVYEIVYDPKTFAVGTAFFVQVLAAGDIDWTAAEATLSRPLYAPQREAKDVDEFRLSLRSESNDAVNDVLFFSASEEAIETYMIGHDLLKKGTPTEAKKAQMWAIKDGKNLCDVEATLVNDEATTPLNLYAPNAGQYILAVEEMPEDANLYLTYNGNVIWDLTASPYVLDLTKGTTTGYALRIVAANAPQITTGVDDVQGGEAQVRKVIIDNKMYIITPEGAIFDAIGKKVQ